MTSLHSAAIRIETWSHLKLVFAHHSTYTLYVFSRDTHSIALHGDILKLCENKKKLEIKVDSENFLKLFKVHNSDRKIVTDTSNEVNRIRNIKMSFDVEKTQYDGNDLVDLYFEFQVYLY